MSSPWMSSQASAALPLLPPDWARPAPEPALTRGAKAAREFESYLIGSLLESLEKTFATVPGEPPIPGQDEYSYLGREALASAMTAAGGFGIAKMISEHLAGPHESNGPRPYVPTSGAGSNR